MASKNEELAEASSIGCDSKASGLIEDKNVVGLREASPASDVGDSRKPTLNFSKDISNKEDVASAAPSKEGVVASKTEKEEIDASKQKKMEAGPAANLPSMLQKNQTREHLEAENNALRKQLFTLRKKLSEAVGQNEAYASSIEIVIAHAKTESWCKEQREFIKTALQVKGRTPVDTKEVEGTPPLARGARRRQGRKKRGVKEANRRSHSEDHNRSTNSSEADASESPSGYHDRGRRDIKPKQNDQDQVTSKRNELKGRRRPDHRRRLDEEEQRSWEAPKGNSRFGRSGPKHEAKGSRSADPEADAIRNSLRNATSVKGLEEAMSKAQSKNMCYEVNLGKRKLEKLRRGG
eukprot:GHVN01034387.1.p3 GENE.GHVN01034387.1~~GHVN01034387.1.p3  ORF type:complete len:350 (-),score=56.92 GHVN01034387.1:4589-5638(-)